MTPSEQKTCELFPWIVYDRPLKAVGAFNGKDYTLPANYKLRATGWCNDYMKMQQVVAEDGERYSVSVADLQEAKIAPAKK